MAETKTYDVLTFGETMLRLSPKNYKTLEQAEDYEIGTAGTESNAAVALVRLGLKAAWFSKLVNNPIGRKTANCIRAHGVDVSHVVWTEQGRVGLAFIELGSQPRASEVVYDRANSAASTLQESEIDWTLLEKAKHLHVTGITAALSPSCAECVGSAIRRAKAAGLSVSFDVNYRRKLWTPEDAAKALAPLMTGVDVLFTTSDDAELLFGINGEPEVAVRRVAEQFQSAWTVMTLGAEGAVGLAERRVRHQKAYPTAVVDRIGAGDAFVAGFLFGFFAYDLEVALKYALAMAAIKMTTPGDLSFTTRQQVEELIAGGATGVRR